MFALSNLSAGAVPSYRFIADAQQAFPHEVVVDAIPADAIWDGTQLVSSPLAHVQRRRLQALEAACRNAITGGYPSSALGSAHIYPSGPTDQANMQASIIASLLPRLSTTWTTPFTCIVPANRANAVWPIKDHTATQIQQAGSDGKAWIIAQRQQLRALIGEVNAATTVDTINAVIWTNAAP